jgi:hypothetical protein
VRVAQRLCCACCTLCNACFNCYLFSLQPFEGTCGTKTTSRWAAGGGLSPHTELRLPARRSLLPRMPKQMAKRILKSGVCMYPCYEGDYFIWVLCHPYLGTVAFSSFVCCYLYAWTHRAACLHVVAVPLSVPSLLLLARCWQLVTRRRRRCPPPA